ncbi:retrovirus-related Pol polyprotein from transposon RE2 [Trichonephila clavipes]|nr:retrovirus-related Pol polyprotein from transposon RE2 [Trichonephila clavipes]
MDGINSEAFYCKRKNEKQTRLCYICRKSNHLAKDCYYRNKNSPSTSQRNNSSRNGHAFTAYHREEKLCDNIWILDSGASCHMAKESVWFKNISPEAEAINCSTQVSNVTSRKGKEKIPLEIWTEETVYVLPPPGYEKLIGDDKVCKLKRSIYGLSQSVRNWYMKIKGELENFGLKQLASDNCVFIKSVNQSVLILCMYVDDLAIFCNNDKMYEDIVSKIKNVFEVVENKTNKFLGMEIEKYENGIYLSQCDYINSLLVKHNLENCKSVKTPIVKGEDKVFPSTNEFIDITMYQELIGELLYLANRTRPDISFVMSYLSQFNHNPEKRHYNLAKRVLKYLMVSKDKKLLYENEFGILNASSDVSWGNAENGKSFSGGVVLLAFVNDYHFRKSEEYDVKFRGKLARSFYVDNVVTSVENKEELKRFIQESTILMSRGRFELLEWEHSGQCRNLEVPRSVQVTKENLSNCIIHTFVDGSQDAYAAVAFLRIEKEDRTEVFFLTSKARVSSLIGATIPRMELLAAVIGTRLTNSVIKALQWENVKRYYWSDSTTVLAWIRRDDNWSVFVCNRVNDIRKLSDPTSHVPGEKNPADLSSRGCNAKQFLSSRWWEGPKWMKGPFEFTHLTDIVNNSYDEDEIEK